MVKFKFTDCIDDDNFITVEKEIVEYADSISNCVKVEAVRLFLSFEGEEVYIDLDKKTAIKFAKTLRTEINKIQ